MSSHTPTSHPANPPSTGQPYAVRQRLEALVEGLSSPADFEHPPRPQQQHTSSSLSPSPSSSPTPEETLNIPPIVTVAGPSAGPRCANKVVIVTGANSASGIGRASAHQFAANGARAVYVCDYQSTNLDTHKRDIEAAHPHCSVHAVQLDVSDDDAVKALVTDAVTKYGRLDVMFANAGISGFPHSFEHIDVDEFMETMKINALGVFLCFKHAAVAMRECIKRGRQVGGSLIGTASVAGLRSNAGGTAYSASKAAVVSIAQTMAYQLTGTGIRANAICPGLIETGMTQPMFDMARQRGTERKLGQLNPIKRGGVADEIARVALFLGSDEASYVNGQAWAVCGGLSAGHPFVPGKLA